MSKMADKMFHIFAGDLNNYGQDVDKDGIPGKGGMRVKRPLTPKLIDDHLKGIVGIGVYPVWHNEDGILMTAWGCCDIDTGDWSEAYGLATALRSMGMVPHIERSRSKGWHIWIFPDQAVTAKAMRRALKVAYAAIELPAKEANPKQESLKPGAVGNYVRLPYKAVLSIKTPNLERQCFMRGWDSKGEGVPVAASDWLYEYDSSFNTPSSCVDEWGARYKEPEHKHIVGDIPVYDDTQLGAMLSGLPGDLMLFVRNGPQYDRSGGLVALAHKLRSIGYTAEEIFNVVNVAHDLWGAKYANHHNPEAYLKDIVERAVQ